MVTRQSITVCLVILASVMITMNLYTLLIFWKSKLDDRLLELRNTRAIQSDFFKHHRSHDDSRNDGDVSSVRFRMYEQDGQYLLLIPNDLNLSTEYWQSLEAELLAKLEYDNTLALTSPTSNKIGPFDRRLRRAFGVGYRDSSDKKSTTTFDSTQMWKSIEDWPATDFLRDGGMEDMLRFLRNVKIQQVSTSRKGTQLKLELAFEGGKLGLFKPSWYARDVKLRGDPYGGKDRHYGEIASFYLAHLLGYRSGPIVVGRKLDLAKDVAPFSTPQLNSTFYQNSDGEYCFYGVCYYCKATDPVCSKQGTLEGAVVMLIKHKLKLFPSPWRRTYKKNQFADWERNSSFCHNVFRELPAPQRKKIILEIVAISVFDFLIGNADRHHLDLFEQEVAISGHVQTFALLDNGKSFGDAGEDYYDILAPLYQCCIIRQELYSVLRRFRGVLGKSFDALTLTDPLYPLLTPAHLTAMDRRLNLVISTIEVCQDRVGGTAKVIL